MGQFTTNRSVTYTAATGGKNIDITTGATAITTSNAAVKFLVSDVDLSNDAATTQPLVEELLNLEQLLQQLM